MAYPKLERAIAFAFEAHSGHYRTGQDGLPYFVHPIDVLAKTRHMGQITDEDVLCAAVLHDVLEDTGSTREVLAHAFGHEVAFLVVQLTRRSPTPDEISLAGGDERAAYLAVLLEEMKGMSASAQVIKLADRLSNLIECSRTRPVEKTQRYAREALAMLECVSRSNAPILWDSLMEWAQRLAD